MKFQQNEGCALEKAFIIWYVINPALFFTKYRDTLNWCNMQIITITIEKFKLFELQNHTLTYHYYYYCYCKQDVNKNSFTIKEPQFPPIFCEELSVREIFWLNVTYLVSSFHFKTSIILIAITYSIWLQFCFLITMIEIS